MKVICVIIVVEFVDLELVYLVIVDIVIYLFIEL